MGIQYLFSLNSGRSGSDYLTELLAQAMHTVSLHEGLPIMNGTAMQRFNDGDDSELHALMPLKLREIRKKSKNGQKIYCETNHSYIKGWGYLLPQYIPPAQIGIIILHRDVEATAHSLLRVHEVPGINEWSRTWYLSPNVSKNLSKPPENANPYELCKWYVEETNLRAQDYKRRFPEMTYWECDLKHLNDYDFVIQMFETFGLQPTPALKELVGKPLNTRMEWPNRSLEQLLVKSNYKTADQLNSAKRDSLINEIVTYLHKHKTTEIIKKKPNQEMGRTLAVAATEIVAYAEDELEEVFQCKIKFTETEHILIGEFLRSISSPFDIFYVFSDRSPAPGIRYTYNFNIVMEVSILIQKFGPLGMLKMLWMVATGIWGKDYSHRASNKSLPRQAT